MIAGLLCEVEQSDCITKPSSSAAALRQNMTRHNILSISTDKTR